jgi:hypothetical protein
MAVLQSITGLRGVAICTPVSYPEALLYDCRNVDRLSLFVFVCLSSLKLG